MQRYKKLMNTPKKSIQKIYKNENTEKSMFFKGNRKPFAKESTTTNNEVFSTKADFLESIMPEQTQVNPNILRVGKSEHTELKPQTIDMGQIDSSLMVNRENLINEISGYIIETQINNAPSLEVNMKHQELGNINLMVNKSNPEGLDIVLTTNNAQANMVLNDSKLDLLNPLSAAGIQVADVKIDQSSNSSSFAQNFGESSQNQNSSRQQNSNQRDSERRRQLWEEFYNRDAA